MRRQGARTCTTREYVRSRAACAAGVSPPPPPPPPFTLPLVLSFASSPPTPGDGAQNQPQPVQSAGRLVPWLGGRQGCHRFLLGVNLMTVGGMGGGHRLNGQGLHDNGPVAPDGRVSCVCACVCAAKRPNPGRIKSGWVGSANPIGLGRVELKGPCTHRWRCGVTGWCNRRREGGVVSRGGKKGVVR